MTQRAKEKTVKDALQAYLGEIGDEQLLTHEEEISLAKLVHKGDALFHIACFEKRSHVFDTLESFEEEFQEDRM